jgi:hypothetical protein
VSPVNGPSYGSGLRVRFPSSVQGDQDEIRWESAKFAADREVAETDEDVPRARTFEVLLEPMPLTLASLQVSALCVESCCGGAHSIDAECVD